jgi:predicted DNA-binding protein (MmcQ/YjbR family)
LVDAGLAQPHHLYPRSNWVSFYLKEEADIERAVALLRRSYELVRDKGRMRPS